VAFPPAPTFTYHGTGRDSFGNSLGNNENAVLLLKRGTEIIAEAPIAEGLRQGENFRIQAPMDLGENDPYTDKAVDSGDLVYFEVRFPDRTLPVTAIRTLVNQVGQPAGVVRFDFTIGADLDGDGLPDDWEYYQLDEAGLNPGDELYSLATFGPGDHDKDGVSDFSEYIAGTFAFLNPDSFKLRIVSTDDEGYTQILLDVKFGRRYRFETSPDMAKWTLTKVNEMGSRTEATGEYRAEDDARLSLEIPPDGEANASLFVRASVR